MAQLDSKGRCCGRKPLVYKRHDPPRFPAGYFCDRCNRSFDAVTGEQQDNFAWKCVDRMFFKRKVGE